MENKAKRKPHGEHSWGSLAIVIGMSEGLIVLGHWALYETIRFAFSVDQFQVRAWFAGVLLFLSFTFPLFQVLITRVRSRVVDVLYTASGIWIGTAHTLLLACGAFWIAAAVEFPPQHPSSWVFLSSTLFGLGLFASAYSIYHSFDTRYTRYRVHLPNLPQAWHNRTMVMAADMHLGNIRKARSAKKLVRMINAEHPDIVLLPGDYFDGPPADYTALAAPLAGIQAPLGTYFSEGNHEEFSDPEKYLVALRAAGVKLLTNEKVEIDGLQLIGVRYEDSYAPKDVEETLASIPFDRSRPSILLKHAPSARRATAKFGISLMLSGHTHDGQMWPFNFIARRLFGKGSYGYSVKDGMQIITTSGFGTWGPLQRFFTKAEIVVITFD